jgi:hypothetical protein
MCTKSAVQVREEKMEENGKKEQGCWPSCLSQSGQAWRSGLASLSFVSQREH